jgi:predicted RNA-binding Zn-ribbon protein involved in translation (DUF1610 family)
LFVLRRYDKIQKRRVGMAETYCSNCGINITTLKESARFCPSCGEVVERVEKKQTPPRTTQDQPHNNRPMRKGPYNKWIALLLLVCLGALGAHKFYEEKIGMGILYLLTLGLFGVGLFFDFFAILFKPTEYYL